MDAKVMEIRLKKWMPIFEEQAKSGLSKNAWCERNGIRKWEFYERQRECRRYLLEKDEDLKDVSEVTSLIPSFVELPAETAGVVTSAAASTTKEEPGHLEVTCGKFGVSITGEVNERMLAMVIREIYHVRLYLQYLLEKMAEAIDAGNADDRAFLESMMPWSPEYRE